MQKRERGIWQRRYYEHAIRDAEDFARHVDYIHWNPVKHGWVQRVSEWPYSSFHRFVREGRLADDWGASSACRALDLEALGFAAQPTKARAPQRTVEP